MSTETTPEHAAYLLQTDGSAKPNPAGVEAHARYQAALVDRDRLNRSWAGARLAALFHQYAWLDAITLSFTVTSEYDDSGGYHRCVHCETSDVRAVPGHPLPEESTTEGDFDPDAAASFFDDEIQEDDWDLYASLAEYPEGYDDVVVVLERAPIADLLKQVPFDGNLASVAWGLTRATPA